MDADDVPQMSAEQRQNGGQVAPERFVYFIHARDAGLIKIGMAVDPERRMGALQVGSPNKLNLLGVIRPLDAERAERSFHAAFRAHRSHGEWFYENDELLRVIGTFAVSFEQARRDIMISWVNRAWLGRAVPWRERVGAHLIEVGMTYPFQTEEPPPSPKERKRGTPKECLASYKAARGIA